jgi:DNA-binding MurR/RpiR family transcriptional regulator
MSILLNRLLVILNDEKLDSIYYHIAFTLLVNLDRINTMYIAEIAELCAVSKSMISKFVRAIGFEDYKEFVAAAPFIENKYRNDLNYNKNIMGYLDNNGIDSYLNIIKDDIVNFENSLDMESIDELAQDLISYKYVAAFGLLYSETAALDLQTKLAYNKKFIVTHLNDVKQDEYIMNADEKTLIIIFSNSGDYIDKYRMSEGKPKKSCFYKTKAKVVLITSNEKMKDDPRVDLCIPICYTTNIQTHSIIFQLLTDVITHRYRYFVRNQGK